MKHVLVVGSGIAGLIAAIELSRKFAVTLVTKAQLADSNTRWAQGGIAAALFADDSVQEHVDDTMRAGAGLCDLRAVEVLCAEGPGRIRELIGLGVAFDLQGGDLARGLEAAHSRARVLHAGGDATGLTIEMALVRAVRAANVEVMEHTFACDLILEAGRVAGIETMREDGRREKLWADAVVLASGGAGQLYRHTTNPAVATGDGVAMALRAGAEVANVEFYQFHPTALVGPETFLISEAVRGEGAVLLDADGGRFMQRVDRAAELAPRDVVARGIARQMAAQYGRPVMLDATALGAEFLRTRFPTIDAACRRFGMEWSREPIPVTPAAHYWMGGVRTDLEGRTSLPGLYAVGEVACTGVHGANRLASNSLLESLVFAWRCAEEMLRQDDLSGNWPEGEAESIAVTEIDLADATGTETIDRGNLQGLMWEAAGIERDGSSLREAQVRLSRWRGGSGSVEQLETANLLVLAQVVLAAAIAREESRGAHYRTDFPVLSAEFAHSLPFRAHVLRAVAASC